MRHDFYKGICYTKTDGKLIDYPTFSYKGMQFRGKEPNLDKEYITCIGSAHTFGRYIADPYPDLLEKKLGIQVLNLGKPAGSPLRYHTQEDVIDLINGSKLCIIQVMSARFSSNAEAKYIGANHFLYKDQKISTSDYWRLKLSKHCKNRSEMIKESLDNYIQDMRILFDKIHVPKLLLWFSTRKPCTLFRNKHRKNHSKFYGNFPQMVDAHTLGILRKSADSYVQVSSSKGLPNKFIKNGKTVKLTYSFRREYNIKSDKLKYKAKTSNNYYPSQQMQQIAANTLEPFCREII